MAYADYEFYTTSYFGNVVPETDFPRYAELASREIDGITNKRLRKWFPDDEDEQNDIKWAVCVLADAIYRKDMLVNSGLENIGNEEGHSKVISSKTSGSESIHYDTGGASSNSLEGAAVKGSVNIGSVLDDVKGKFLSGIMYKDKGYTILFRGVGCE